MMLTNLHHRSHHLKVRILNTVYCSAQAELRAVHSMTCPNHRCCTLRLFPESSIPVPMHLTNLQGNSRYFRICMDMSRFYILIMNSMSHLFSFPLKSFSFSKLIWPPNLDRAEVLLRVLSSFYRKAITLQLQGWHTLNLPGTQNRWPMYTPGTPTTPD